MHRRSGVATRTGWAEATAHASTAPSTAQARATARRRAPRARARRRGGLRCGGRDHAPRAPKPAAAARRARPSPDQDDAMLDLIAVGLDPREVHALGHEVAVVVASVPRRVDGTGQLRRGPDHLAHAMAADVVHDQADARLARE